MEESEYQKFFKTALEKAGKSITSMSDDEKKKFLTKSMQLGKLREKKKDD